MAASGEPEKVDLASPDLAAGYREALAAAFPGVLADGVLDVPRLAELLDVDVAGLAEGRERYGLMWAGKLEAVRSLLTPSHATLVPDFERSIDFDTAQNVFIEGDNLEVLKLLQKAYNDKVKLIYIDPPYNTGNDFVYNDDFSDGLRGYLEYTGQVDDEGNRTSANAETQGRRHSKWLSMMYPRLALARNLLTQDGLVFVSIDDNEVHNLRQVMDEVFGSTNWLATVVWDRGHSQQQGIFKEYHEYVLAYARDRSKLTHFVDRDGGDVIGGALKKISKANPASEFTFPAGVRCEAADGTEFSGTWGEAEKVTLVNGRFNVLGGRTTEPMTLSAGWTQKDQMARLFAGELPVLDTRGQEVLEFFFSSTGKLKYRKNRSVLTPSTVQRWGKQATASAGLTELLGGDYFDRPKPIELVQDIVAWSTAGDDIVLDFFCGSATTPHAVMAQNAKDGGQRRWIAVNLPELTEEGSPAWTAGLRSLTDVGLMRARVAANAIGADQSVRVFNLGESNFATRRGRGGEQSANHIPELFATTLLPGADPNNVAAEALLAEGVGLSMRWDRVAVGAVHAVVAGSVAVVLTDEISSQVVEAAFSIGSRVVVFFEDGFAGRDALKANAVVNAKNRGITMKTV